MQNLCIAFFFSSFFFVIESPSADRSQQ